MNTLRPQAPTPEIQIELQRLMLSVETMTALNNEMREKLQPVMPSSQEAIYNVAHVAEERPTTPLGEFVRRIDDMLRDQITQTRATIDAIAF